MGLSLEFKQVASFLVGRGLCCMLVVTTLHVNVGR